MTSLQRFGSILVAGFVRRGAVGKRMATHAAAVLSYNSPSSPLTTASNPMALRSFSSLHTTEEVTLPSHDLSSFTNEELADTSTIPGWDLVHTPPRKFPRGALVGKVVSDKMNKTINVAVERYKIVPKYRKRVKYTRKFMAHDEQEVANLGDLVMILPCNRISRHKHFMLREIIRPKGQL